MSRKIKGLLSPEILKIVDSFLHVSREQTDKYWRSVQSKNKTLIRRAYIKRLIERIRKRNNRRLIFHMISSYHLTSQIRALESTI